MIALINRRLLAFSIMNGQARDGNLQKTNLFDFNTAIPIIIDQVLAGILPGRIKIISGVGSDFDV
ncbi:hypothetical protein C2W62_14180 [Candidatus Entotheonella serta]|nr:hypothetical protein C2W62_14180 [Candidatus Entotheonella serta]